MYFAYGKPIHLTPIWSPDVDGDGDDDTSCDHQKPENFTIIPGYDGEMDGCLMTTRGPTRKHEKDECFERGLDFTFRPPKKHQKTHTHGSMKKTNVSSEVLILLEKLENVSPRAHEFWIPKQAPKWVQEQPKTGSLFGPNFDPILSRF